MRAGVLGAGAGTDAPRQGWGWGRAGRPPWATEGQQAERAERQRPTGFSRAQVDLKRRLRDERFFVATQADKISLLFTSSDSSDSVLILFGWLRYLFGWLRCKKLCLHEFSKTWITMTVAGATGSGSYL